MKLKIKKGIVFQMVFLLLFAGPVIVWAGFQNPLKTESFSELAKAIITWVRNIALSLAVIMIIWAGVLYMTAMGKAEQITKAHQALKWALIGLAIVIIGSGWIVFINAILQKGG